MFLSSFRLGVNFRFDMKVVVNNMTLIPRFIPNHVIHCLEAGRWLINRNRFSSLRPVTVVFIKTEGVPLNTFAAKHKQVIAFFVEHVSGLLEDVEAELKSMRNNAVNIEFLKKRTEKLTEDVEKLIRNGSGKHQ